MARAELVWPMYFMAEPLVGARVVYQRGDLCEIQTKDYVRSLGKNFGVADAETRPFSELPYVKVVNARSRGMADQITKQGLRYKDAAKLVGEAV